MQNTINNQNALTTPPVGGWGAKKYIKPRIEWIPLDNDISLALESAPPTGPDEGTLFPTPLNNDPFKTNLV